MILRIEKLQTELPPPSEPDPVGASAVQELLGGKYGEMSTFMNYTYQSFNFRSRQQARPFYDLVASIAAEEFGHIGLVSTAINTMLTGAAGGEPGEVGDLGAVKGVRNTQHFIAGGAGSLVQDSSAKPWNGDYVFASGDLIEDLTHNFFLETGRATTSSRCMRWSIIRRLGRSPATCWCAVASTRSRMPARWRT